MRPPILHENGYFATFTRRNFGGRPSWIHTFGLSEPGPWPVIQTGRLMWWWELAHAWYLGISRADWDRMTRRQRMEAELRLQLMFWVPDQYATQAARQTEPEAFAAWSDMLDLDMVAPESDADAFLKNPYGPGPEARFEAAYWRCVLRAKDWPIPKYASPRPMPFSLAEARRMEHLFAGGASVAEVFGDLDVPGMDRAATAQERKKGG
ncbi:MAG TPA: hypothetical protein PK313_04265 [Myxococcota bacterium]|nr:hypothetical protein [Myxococcota bacterium]